MPSAVAPPLPGRALFDQRWRNLTFLHWPIEAAKVAHLFPPGTRPDVLDGLTYVGLVPFHMRGAGVGPVSVPYLGDFLETNVRLYSIDDAGRHGVLFRTLDAQRLATVLLARFGLGVPYTWATMSTATSDHTVSYRARRRWPHRGRHSDISVRVGERIEPSDVEVWFTGRWGLHSRHLGMTFWTPNRHEPWPLHAAEVAHLHDQLVAAAGITVDPNSLLRPLWSPGVHTQFGRPQRIA